MNQIKTFKGFVVPEMHLTQTDACDSVRGCVVHDCQHCLFDRTRKETLEPFKQWLEERKK